MVRSTELCSALLYLFCTLQGNAMVGCAVPALGITSIIIALLSADQKLDELKQVSNTEELSPPRGHSSMGRPCFVECMNRVLYHSVHDILNVDIYL